jgi:phage shock protein A
MFQRVSDIVSANVNELIDGFEDPETMLKQAVREMEAAIEASMEAAAKVIANRKLLDKEHDEHRRLADLWSTRAREAVGQSDDDAARRALAHKADHEKLAAALGDQLAAANELSGKLRRQIDAMRVRLAEARQKLLTLVARNRAAEIRRRFSISLGSAAIDSPAFSRFDRMRRRIEQAEAEADAMVELSRWDANLETTDPDIEHELATLKAQQHAEQPTQTDPRQPDNP